jgi:hypothetical protein
MGLHASSILSQARTHTWISAYVYAGARHGHWPRRFSEEERNLNCFFCAVAGIIYHFTGCLFTEFFLSAVTGTVYPSLGWAHTWLHTCMWVLVMVADHTRFSEEDKKTEFLV